MSRVDLDAFRADTRAWLEDNAPASLRGRPGDMFHGTWGGRRGDFESDDHRVWLERMAARGWTAPTWPAEYGGGGLSRKEAAVLAEELKRLKLPAPLIGFGLVMIGPTLLQFGTEAQKRQHLPGIIKGEIRWCQGYSEPGSGSDLASLQTSAVRDGEQYVINGQKIWTSYAEKSDWIFCLVRTDPGARKQEGISFILVDMASPGVTTKPIKLISGASPFCEVFFDDVRAEARDVIGGVNAGWTVAKALLQHERTMVGEVFARSVLGGQQELLALARAAGLGPPEGSLEAPLVRDRIAQSAMDERAFMLTVQRLQDNARAGQPPGPESSILKVYGTELNQRRRQLAVEIAGADGLGWSGDAYDDGALGLTRDWLRSRGNTIEGGTSEIQLNIIAKRVLGLPDAGGAA
ncbi:MAG: acyl-CoA dehydrogenase family protein [Deltaproteobacteria bacterium]|nr:acyl-CoA dehydrogenase family protein [Deltaproteobacteria bacterium]